MPDSIPEERCVDSKDLNSDIYRSRYWAEVELDHLVSNFEIARQLAGNRKMMCVIKGDAFGHGAVPVARVLEDAGADYLAVALPEEALQLRRAGIKTPIMILGIADSAWIVGFAENDITATVGSFESAFNYEKSMTNSICRMQLKVHISINTGMNRIGLQPEDAADQITQIKRECSHLQIEGIWTHFAEAGSEGDSGCFTAGQYEKFQNVVKQLEERNVCFPYVHCANSDAIVTCGEGVLSGTNMARPGNLLYGAIDYSKYGITLKPAMQLKGRIMMIRQIKAGESVSYNRTWTAERNCLIATVGCGTADGWQRGVSNKMEALVRGKRVRQVGQLSMDQMMFDVTEIPEVMSGDIVTFVGRDRDEEIFIKEHAKLVGTGTSELLPAVGKRVPRIYMKGGVVVEKTNLLEQLHLNL